MTARDPRADRPRWEVEDFGDLRVVEVTQVAQYHRDAELLGCHQLGHAGTFLSFDCCV